MGAARIVVIVLALAASIGLGLVVRSMASSPQPQGPAIAAAPVQLMTQVLVAKRDLKPGTRIESADIGWQAWPANAVNALYITDGSAPAPLPATAKEKAIEGAEKAIKTVTSASPAEALYGAIVREALVAGEPIVPSKIVRGGDGGMIAVVLKPGMRAVGVPVTAENGAGGFILPGDHVDVLQSREVPSKTGGPPGRITQVVLRNVRVLAIDQTTKAEKDGVSIVGSVATLEVPIDAAEALVDAKARDDNGQLDLALRSYADMGGPVGRVASIGQVSNTPSTIRVFRSGGEPTEVNSAQ